MEIQKYISSFWKISRFSQRRFYVLFYSQNQSTKNDSSYLLTKALKNLGKNLNVFSKSPFHLRGWSLVSKKVYNQVVNVVQMMMTSFFFLFQLSKPNLYLPSILSIVLWPIYESTYGIFSLLFSSVWQQWLWCLLLGLLCQFCFSKSILCVGK